MMENLHKIVYTFTSTRTEANLITLLNARATAVANSLRVALLGVGETIDVVSKLTLLPGDVWEWYPKMITEATREDIQRRNPDHPDAETRKGDMATEISDALNAIPLINNIIRVK